MKAAAYIGTVRRVASARMPTRWGMFRALGFERDIVNGVHQVETALALVLGDVTAGVPLVRIHSQCFTGEMLGSLRCDCRDQLEMAMQAIAKEGRGLLIYEYQEGRGIGLSAKLQAYALQDSGLDTVEANHALGFAADCRDFSVPAAILHDLGLSRIRLLSNNRHKIDALVDSGIEVVVQVPCEAAPTPHSLAYLRTKKEKMGHALSLGRHESTEYDWDFEFASIEEAIGELEAGRMIVVVDDEDRENEGDLTMAAEMITPEAVNFMAMHGRGLICLAMTGERLDDLELAPMSPDNTALGGTAFTASIDVIGPDVTTGISARDRAQTILAVTDASSRPDDFARPGHVFPLRARAGGVLERRGQTEAAVDMASLAGLYPAGVICEIVNDDGTMARVPDLVRFCKKHKLVMITVSELARYRMDLDDGATLEALEGFIPVCPRFSAQGARRFEPGDLIAIPTAPALEPTAVAA
ncbi:MAG: 3,4-dihydroxy 2-butanone 4-phosphate synthase / cyclohydrolase [Alphaproteobacteria bacterium]|nr:3,4-dihydroxy 2-butanone 4-phosphate synthase / cyclohydrolase [Alphaproteobacteria bacterium]